MPRAGSVLLVGLLLIAPAWAQENPVRLPQPAGGAVEPDQPVRPNVPTLIQRPPQEPQQPQAPFTLTQDEQAQVDRVLAQWEERNRRIKTFDCRFARWIWNTVFGPADKPQSIEYGVLKYKAPDCGLFRIDTTLKDGKEAPIDDSRAEHWIADGKSIFEYRPAKKQIVEHKLPPELQGKAIADSPLPFLFGSEVKKLKERYFIRLITPENVQDKIFIEAFPRHQHDKANWHHAQFIVTAGKMEPFALNVYQPNGKDRTAYQFYEIAINRWEPFSNPFRPFTPLGWQRIVEEPPQRVEAARGQSATTR